MAMARGAKEQNKVDVIQKSKNKHVGYSEYLDALWMDLGGQRRSPCSAACFRGF